MSERRLMITIDSWDKHCHACAWLEMGDGGVEDYCRLFQGEVAWNGEGGFLRATACLEAEALAAAIQPVKEPHDGHTV